MARWEIPLSDLDLGDAEVEAVTRVVRSQWLTAGGEVRAFEAEFAASCDVEAAVALANCTAALHLSLSALGVQPGDEVIVPSITFVATANAVVLAGGTPVFADSVGSEDLTIDPAHVESLIGPRTVGMIVVHYGGFASRLSELLDIRNRHGLFLIEDVAHAPGGRFGDAALGTLGDTGCFSFFGNKNLTTGEGGMVLARSEEVLTRIRLLRSHGMSSLSWDRFAGHASSYEVVSPGYNYRPTEVMGALGRVQLARLPEANRRRMELLRRYQANLAKLPGVIVPFKDREGTGHVSVAAFATTELRNFVRAALTEARVQTSLHYPPVHLFRHYRETLGTGPGDLAIAERWAQTSITLPLYPTLTEEQVDRVCSVVAKVVDGRSDAGSS